VGDVISRVHDDSIRSRDLGLELVGRAAAMILPGRPRDGVRERVRFLEYWVVSRRVTPR